MVAADPAAPVTGRAADLLQATATAWEAAARLIRPGKKAGEVAPVLAKIAEAYGCSLVVGVMSNQMKRFVIDADKAACNRAMVDQRFDEKCEFEEGEVYAIDIIMSTGEGKPK